MAAGVYGKGASHVKSKLWTAALKGHYQKLHDASCNVKGFLPEDAVGRRHFFKSVRAAVSYYYDVILHTGNRFGAGTDANVFMELYGDKGSSGEIHLPSKKGDLERGMVNKYKVASKDLGVLQKVSIRHDNTGLAPAWYLEKVTVKDHSGSRFLFDCGQWLLKRGSDEKLNAELSLTEQNIDQPSSYKGKNVKYVKLNEKEHLDAVEETVHENLANVLQGIVNSSPETDAESVSDFGSLEENNGSNVVGIRDMPFLPAARLLVEAFGLMKGQIPATGPKGHLLKGDVLKYIEANKLTRPKVTTPVTGENKTPKKKLSTSGMTQSIKVGKDAAQSTVSTEYEDRPLSQHEKLNANRYLESKQTMPHFYTTAVCNLNNVVNICKDLSQQGSHVSTTAFFVKAASSALDRVPEMNINYVNDTATQLESIHIAVTRYSSKGNHGGLIRTVDQASLKEIQDSVEQFKFEEAGDNGGSFAVVDLSGSKLTQFAEIIRPPRVCVLTIGSPRFALSENEALMNLCTITLSCDGRLINENTASKFLNIFKKIIENPNAYI